MILELALLSALTTATDPFQTIEDELVAAGKKPFEQPAPPPTHPQTFTVPPRSEKECLQQTHGIKDENYKTCRDGHSYTLNIRDNR